MDENNEHRAFACNFLSPLYFGAFPEHHREIPRRTRKGDWAKIDKMDETRTRNHVSPCGSGGSNPPLSANGSQMRHSRGKCANCARVGAICAHGPSAPEGENHSISSAERSEHPAIPHGLGGLKQMEEHAKLANEERGRITGRTFPILGRQNLVGVRRTRPVGRAVRKKARRKVMFRSLGVRCARRCRRS